MSSELWRRFHDWVEGVGPRPENEVIPPEPPPDLPFTRRPQMRRSRFHELTIRERYDAWINHHGRGLFSSLYAGVGVVACALLAAALLAVVAALPEGPINPANDGTLRRHVQHGGAETGAQNIEAAMARASRGSEAFGEPAVLFAAAASVLMALGASRRGGAEEDGTPCPHLRDERQLQRGPPAHMNDAILRGVAYVAAPVVLLLGCLALLNERLSPGGGAVLALGLLIGANAWGFGRVRRLPHERGLLLAAGTALLMGGLNAALGFAVAGVLYALYALFSEGEF